MHHPLQAGGLAERRRWWEMRSAPCSQARSCSPPPSSCIPHPAPPPHTDVVKDDGATCLYNGGGGGVGWAEEGGRVGGTEASGHERAPNRHGQWKSEPPRLLNRCMWLLLQLAQQAWPVGQRAAVPVW